MRVSGGIATVLVFLFSGGSVGAATPGSFDHFRCMLTGHWDNARQASDDVLLGKDEQNTHPRRAMTYVPVANPGLDGQLFAILNYAEQGFDGPPLRVSLHRFRPDENTQTIIHEFFFLKKPDTFGDLQSNFASLAGLREDDVRVNDRCSMRWQWAGGHYTGSTTPGSCVTDSFTDEPILVEGHGELWPDRLVRHDRNFELSGAAIAIPGGATPEIFDRASRANMHADLAGQIDAVAARLSCPDADN